MWTHWVQGLGLCDQCIFARIWDQDDLNDHKQLNIRKKTVGFPTCQQDMQNIHTTHPLPYTSRSLRNVPFRIIAYCSLFFHFDQTPPSLLPYFPHLLFIFLRRLLITHFGYVLCTTTWESEKFQSVQSTARMWFVI